MPVERIHVQIESGGLEADEAIEYGLADKILQKAPEIISDKSDSE